MSTQEEKYNNITAKLEQRHRERLEQFEQRRQLRLKDKDDTCDLQEGFLEQFNNEKRAVIIQLDFFFEQALLETSILQPWRCMQ